MAMGKNQMTAAINHSVYSPGYLRALGKGGDNVLPAMHDMNGNALRGLAAERMGAEIVQAGQ